MTIILIRRFFHQRDSIEIEQASRASTCAWRVLIKFAQHICRFSLAHSLINMQMQTNSRDTDC